MDDAPSLLYHIDVDWDAAGVTNCASPSHVIKETEARSDESQHPSRVEASTFLCGTHGGEAKKVGLCQIDISTHYLEERTFI